MTPLIWHRYHQSFLLIMRLYVLVKRDPPFFVDERGRSHLNHAFNKAAFVSRDTLQSVL